jgi:two-component system KDP operon response regulator KdpE
MTHLRVLVVEDDPSLVQLLRATLEGQGMQSIDARSAADAIFLCRSHNPDLVLLDLGLPDRDGMEVLRELRGWFSKPIIVLSARRKEDDKVRALDEGADDYLAKPFGAQELLARLRVALRHDLRRTTEDPLVLTGSLRIDLSARTVHRGGVQVHLTPIEYRLLDVLARSPGKLLTKTQLLSEVWGPGAGEQAHYLRIYMSQLRHKLEEEPANPRFLLTESGVGYRLAALPADPRT